MSKKKELLTRENVKSFEGEYCIFDLEKSQEFPFYIDSKEKDISRNICKIQNVDLHRDTSGEGYIIITLQSVADSSYKRDLVSDIPLNVTLEEIERRLRILFPKPDSKDILELEL